MTADVALLTSMEVCTRAGLTYRVLDRWTRLSAITPSRPATGTGSAVGWSPTEAAAISAIAAVRRDLLALGLSVPRTLVTELWGQLTATGAANLATDTVSIHVPVRLGLEDR